MIVHKYFNKDLGIEREDQVCTAFGWLSNNDICISII